MWQSAGGASELNRKWIFHLLSFEFMKPVGEDTRTNYLISNITSNTDQQTE